MNKQKRHKPEEIILLLREFDSGSLSQESFCQQKQISVATLNRWRKKFGMMPIAQDPVGAPRLQLFFDGLLQDFYPEHGIGIHLLELGVFLLKGFEPFGIRHQ